MGRRPRSMSLPVRTISWQGAPPTVLGFIAITLRSRGSMSSASRQPPGGSGWRRKASVSPTPRNSWGSRSMPQATRSTVPKRLTSTGMSERVPSARTTFSNSTAGPFSASSLVWISVISRCGDTGAIPRPSPGEFEDLLSASGKRVLAGTHALCGRLADPKVRFLERDDLLDRIKAERVRRALETALVDKLEALERPIPPESIFGMRRDYGELLPKTSRAHTLYFDSRREPGVKEAERIGLARLMRSASFRAFAEALAGRKLAG